MKDHLVSDGYGEASQSLNFPEVTQTQTKQTMIFRHLSHLWICRLQLLLEARLSKQAHQTKYWARGRNTITQYEIAVCCAKNQEEAPHYILRNWSTTSFSDPTGASCAPVGVSSILFSLSQKATSSLTFSAEVQVQIFRL